MAAPQAPTGELGVAPPPLPAQVVADPRHDGTVASRVGDGDPLPLPGAQIPTPWITVG